MNMTNTRMIKWIAVLTSTQTWSWSGLSFVLEPRGTLVLIRFLLSLYSCGFKCSVPTLSQWGIFASQNSFKVCLFGCNSLFIAILSVFDKKYATISFLRFDDHILWPLTIIYLMMGATGTCGNILVCHVILRLSILVLENLSLMWLFPCPRNVSMRTSTNFFLFSLAVADIAILLMGEAINSTLLATNLCN